MLASHVNGASRRKFMTEEEKGVDGEEETPEVSPTEPESPAGGEQEPKEPEKKPDDEQRVPYDRFAEVNEKKHALEVELAESKARLDEITKASGRRELTPEEKQEQQAQQWVQKQIDQALEPYKEKQAVNDRIANEEKIIEDRLSLIRTADKTVDDKVEMKIYDLIDEYHIGNGVDSKGKPVYAIDVAYQLYKKLEGDKNTAKIEGAKEAGRAPHQPQGGGGGGNVPIDVSSKSFHELAEDAKREAGLK